MTPQAKQGRTKGGSNRGVSRRSVLVSAGIVGLASAAGLFAWWPGGKAVSHAYALAPESALPPELREAPPNVREAYRFAMVNRETLRHIPCYCGCGGQHPSNYECYIKGVGADGSYRFDYMSLG